MQCKGWGQQRTRRPKKIKPIQFDAGLVRTRLVSAQQADARHRDTQADAVGCKQRGEGIISEKGVSVNKLIIKVNRVLSCGSIPDSRA